MAEDKANETIRHVVAECGPPIDLIVDSSWLEKTVFGDFRIWHILFSGMAVFTGVTVVLCCLFRCRIPRTKQEIEADFLRKKITESFRTHLEKIKIDELQGQYDTGNLLPLFKKVELFEEDRIQKNEGFEKRKLTWRQKLKRLFSGKDSFDEYGERSLDESKGEHGADYKKMTEEEMETVEKEVEGAKTDTSALNMINDQIAIFGFIGESKKDRKKRLREQKKAEKAAQKLQKAQEKLEKKLAKQQPRKSIAGTSLSARSKSAKALLELRPDSLEKDQQLWIDQPVTKISLENGGDSITIDIENRSDVPDAIAVTMSSGNEAEFDGEVNLADAEDKGYEEISVAIPEKEEVVQSPPPKKSTSFASRFSFRDTVSKLINFRSKPKQKEELVINIGLVKKDDDGTPTPPPTVTIPHIECSPPEPHEDDYAVLQQEQAQEQQQHKKRKMKMVKKDSVMAKDESLDRNLLQIPEISKTTKEVNSERKSKERVDKKKRRDGKDQKPVKDTEEEMDSVPAKLGKSDKHKEKVKAMEVPEPIYSVPEKKGHKERTKKPDKMAKEEKDKTDSLKRSQLKRQIGAEDGQAEKGKLPVEPIEPVKREKKGKVKSAIEPIRHGKEGDKKAKEIYLEQEKPGKRPKEKHKDAKFEEETSSAKAEVRLLPKEGKSKSKQKGESEALIPEPVKDEPKKEKEKPKRKHLEFDDRSIEQTQSVLRESKEHTAKTDRRMETFPMVVEEMTRQRKAKKRDTELADWRHSIAREQPTEPTKYLAKERDHGVKTPEKSTTKDRPRRPKSHEAESSKPIAATGSETEKRNDFNRMVTNLNEELKQAIDQRRKRQMKRSKTIVEDVITPQEDQQLRTRSREEFKKRLSEVLLQRMTGKAEADTESSQVASASIVRHTSNKSLDGTSSEMMAAKSRQIRVITKQATSSSELEIPVEHIYTRGLTCVQVHPSSIDLLEAQAEGTQIRHPVAPGPVTISAPPSPASSRSSTISVVTDNIVKKLVESSPETGENRELTYECSRDVIFSVDQQKHQPSTSSSPTSSKSKRSEKPQLAEAGDQPHSGRPRTKEKTKHKTRHN